MLRRFLYNNLRFLLKKTNFTGEILFECKFNDLADFNAKFYVTDNEFYGENRVFFVKEMVELMPGGGLKIKCQRRTGMATTWEKTAIYHWISGCVTTWNKDKERKHVTIPYGIWIVDAIFPDTWAALWLLKPDYFVPSIRKEHIIPEIDFAENNGNGIDNVVHYGFSPSKYTTKGHLRKMHSQDGKLHQYAVEMLENGYNFYLDGYLINEFRSKDPEFVSSQPNYLLMNNAIKGAFKEDYSELIIKSVKVLKNKL